MRKGYALWVVMSIVSLCASCMLAVVAHAATVHVSFDVNGGSWSGVTDIQYRQGEPEDAVVPPIAPTRTGYTFAGWANSRVADEATLVEGTTFATASPEYFAVWIGGTNVPIADNGVLPYGVNPEGNDADAKATETIPGTVEQTVPASGDSEQNADSAQTGDENASEKDTTSSQLIAPQTHDTQNREGNGVFSGMGGWIAAIIICVVIIVVIVAVRAAHKKKAAQERDIDPDDPSLHLSDKNAVDKRK